MISNARLFLSDYGDFGWGVSSPELPALTSGAATLADFSDDFLRKIAVESGLDPQGSFESYVQRVLVIDESAFVVRVKDDHYYIDRLRLTNEITAHLIDDPDLRAFARKDSLGDAVFLACRSADKVILAAQSMERGEPATAAIARDGHIGYLSLVPPTPVGAEEKRSLESVGLSGDSTLGELFKTVDADEPDSALVAFPEFVLAPV
ncbi:hypothetical protein BH09ACT6_BH09ACT6_18300 [soil metagenome]